jgi:hypothetical protein
MCCVRVPMLLITKKESFREYSVDEYCHVFRVCAYRRGMDW